MTACLELEDDETQEGVQYDRWIVFGKSLDSLCSCANPQARTRRETKMENSARTPNTDVQAEMPRR
jgi:hypothetical protein